MKNINGLEAVTYCLQNMDGEVGWWYHLTIPGRKQPLKEFRFIFPPLSTVFNIPSNAFALHMLEIGLLKRHGENMIFDKKGCEAMKDMVMLGTKIEVTSSIIGSHRDNAFVKLGDTTETPRTIWAKYQIHPRRTHPPFQLASREVTSHSRSIIINAIKNSPYIRNIFKTHLTSSTLTDKSEKNLSSSEEESIIEEVETAVRSHDHKCGSIADTSSSPIMNIFSMPKDNTVTLQHLHYEISKLLIDKDNIMQYSNPINAHHEVNYALMPTGTSRSTNITRSKILMKTMENTGTNNNTNDSNEFISKLLATIDNNYNENFFTYIKKQGCCTKKTPNMPVHFWDAMSEAASLRVTQQRIVRKFLNYHLGDKVIMIDKSEKVKKDMQKNNVAKHEHAANDKLITNTIDEVSTNTKRNFKRKPEESQKVINQGRKKGRRIATRIDVKQEIEAEDRTIAPTNRERLKIEYMETQDA